MWIFRVNICFVFYLVSLLYLTPASRFIWRRLSDRLARKWDRLCILARGVAPSEALLT